MKLKAPYLLFLGESDDILSAKTANAVLQWAPEKCIGQFRLPNCQIDLGISDLTLEAAFEQGARTLIVGVSNRGGRIDSKWVDVFEKALNVGFDIANGLHDKVSDISRLREAAKQSGRNIFDIRQSLESYPIATGTKRTGKRLLTVGTDCSIGKMYTSISLTKALEGLGVDVDFRATGQTGIFIAGGGISVDGVISDFVAGVVETLSPENDPNHWDIVEGQASLAHPSYAGVTHGLIHGAQPDVLIMCHQLHRPHMRGLPHRAMPDVVQCIEEHLMAARHTNPDVRCLGISLNTSNLPDDCREDAINMVSQETGYLCFDPSIDMSKITSELLKI